MTNKCSNAIIITTDMICVVRIIYLFGIFQSRISLWHIIQQTAVLWCFRNGLLVLINGFLSLIRFGDDLDELLLGGLQMRSDVNVKMEYSEDMLMDISRSNLPYGQIKERMIDLWFAVCAITERGNNAEVKRKKDGSFTVYEVKKNIVTLR